MKNISKIIIMMMCLSLLLGIIISDDVKATATEKTDVSNTTEVKSTNSTESSVKKINFKKQKPKIKKVKRSNDNAKIVTWTKMECEGYQIKFSINKHFKKEYKPTTKKIKGGDNNSIECVNLKEKYSYYIKIRAYKKDSKSEIILSSFLSKLNLLINKSQVVFISLNVLSLPKSSNLES